MFLNIPYSSHFIAVSTGFRARTSAVVAFSFCVLVTLLGPGSSRVTAQNATDSTAIPGLPPAFQLPFQLPGQAGNLPQNHEGDTAEEAAEKQLKEHEKLLGEMSYMVTTLFYGVEWQDAKFPEAVEKEKNLMLKASPNTKLVPTWLLIAAERAYLSIHNGEKNPATVNGAHILNADLVKGFWRLDAANNGSFTQTRFGVQNDQKDIDEFHKAIDKGVLDLDAQEFAVRWNAMEWMRVGDKDEVIRSLQEHAKIRTKIFLREKKMMELEMEDMYKVLKENGIEYTGPPPEEGPDAPKPPATTKN